MASSTLKTVSKLRPQAIDFGTVPPSPSTSVNSSVITPSPTFSAHDPVILNSITVNMLHETSMGSPGLTKAAPDHPEPVVAKLRPDAVVFQPSGKALAASEEGRYNAKYQTEITPSPTTATQQSQGRALVYFPPKTENSDESTPASHLSGRALTILVPDEGLCQPSATTTITEPPGRPLPHLETSTPRPKHAQLRVHSSTDARTTHQHTVSQSSSAGSHTSSKTWVPTPPHLQQKYKSCLPMLRQLYKAETWVPHNYSEWLRHFGDMLNECSYHIQHVKYKTPVPYLDNHLRISAEERARIKARLQENMALLQYKTSDTRGLVLGMPTIWCQSYEGWGPEYRYGGTVWPSSKELSHEGEERLVSGKPPQGCEEVPWGHYRRQFPLVRDRNPWNSTVHWKMLHRLQPLEFDQTLKIPLEEDTMMPVEDIRGHEWSKLLNMDLLDAIEELEGIEWKTWLRRWMPSVSADSTPATAFSTSFPPHPSNTARQVSAP